MFGDNKSVVDSSMQLDAKLHKQHTMLSFHRVREAIAAGILGFYFVSGDDNPADSHIKQTLGIYIDSDLGKVEVIVVFERRYIQHNG
jgi:hypothetical protein